MACALKGQHAVSLTESGSRPVPACRGTAPYVAAGAQRAPLPVEAQAELNQPWVSGAPDNSRGA